MFILRQGIIYFTSSFRRIFDVLLHITYYTTLTCSENNYSLLAAAVTLDVERDVDVLVDAVCVVCMSMLI